MEVAGQFPAAIEWPGDGRPASGRVSALVRVHSQPLGFVEADLDGGPAAGEALAAAIERELGAAIRAHLAADGLPTDWPHAVAVPEEPPCLAARRAILAGAPPVSVVVPTVDRPAALRACLEGLLAQSLRRFEIVVIDNAPDESGARAVVESLDAGERTLRYEVERRRGASRARNRGVACASGEVLAFIDGDARPDPAWLAALVAAIETPLEDGTRPACATGAILPSELRTEPQRWLEEWGGYAKGFERRLFDRDVHTTGSPLYPFAAGTFGSGANMAFRASVLRALGGFDVALGPGTAARGGEDLAAFVDVITTGHAIVYEPAALVWHEHHDTEARFRATIRAYGTGLLAYLTRHAVRRPADALRMAFAIPAAIAYFFRSGSPRNIRRSAGFPPGLWKDEVAGMLQGPFAYAFGRTMARRSRRSRMRR